MPIALTQEIKDLINNALTSGSPMALAVVTPDNKPVLSFRGSTQVYSDDALGLWVRAGSGTTAEFETTIVLAATSPLFPTSPIYRNNGPPVGIALVRFSERIPPSSRLTKPSAPGTAVVELPSKASSVATALSTFPAKVPKSAGSTGARWVPGRKTSAAKLKVPARVSVPTCDASVMSTVDRTIASRSKPLTSGETMARTVCAPSERSMAVSML